MQLLIIHHDNLCSNPRRPLPLSKFQIHPNHQIPNLNTNLADSNQEAINFLLIQLPIHQLSQITQGILKLLNYLFGLEYLPDKLFVLWFGEDLQGFY